MLYYFLVLSIISLYGANGQQENMHIFSTKPSVPNNNQQSINNNNNDNSNAASPLSISDADYWDNDDFVPYKDDRHDTFDWRLIRAVLLNDNTNIIVSPFSIKLILVLLSEAAGPGTPTQNELSSVLPNLKNPALIRELYKTILGSLKKQSPDYVLNVGTKIYVDQFIEPRQRYSSIISTHYDTDIERLDFHNSDNSAQIMNNWCENITAGHLKNLVNPADLSSSIMVILNAIFFDGLWKKPFVERNTSEQPFFVTPSNMVRAQFMTQRGFFYYYDSMKLNARIIRLPYKGKKFAMVILLPNAKAGLDELIREIEGDGLKRLQWFMQEIELKVTIPKFKFDYTSHLKGVLKSIGINQIFTTNASLPGLDRGIGLSNQFMVSNVIQKAGLHVYESGSRAFAGTEVSIVNKIGETTPEFLANRPFMFLIEDETTGTILFAGKVTDPTK